MAIATNVTDKEINVNFFEMVMLVKTYSLFFVTLCHALYLQQSYAFILVIN